MKCGQSWLHSQDAGRMNLSSPTRRPQSGGNKPPTKRGSRRRLCLRREIKSVRGLRLRRLKGHGPVGTGAMARVTDCGSPSPIEREKPLTSYACVTPLVQLDFQDRINQYQCAKTMNSFYLLLRLPSLSYNSIQARDVQQLLVVLSYKPKA